jgi:hypothetical protein
MILEDKRVARKKKNKRGAGGEVLATGHNQVQISFHGAY